MPRSGGGVCPRVASREPCKGNPAVNANTPKQVEGVKKAWDSAEAVKFNLLGSGRSHDGDDVHAVPTLLEVPDLHDAVDEREPGVVPAHAAVDAGVHFGTTLPDDDVAREDLLAAVALDTKPL